MVAIHIIAISCIAAFFFCYCHMHDIQFKLPKNSLIIAFSCALLFRILFACLYHGFDADISCFGAWAHRICEVGPAGFYDPDVFTDYPPGYMYVLYLVGAITRIFDIPYLSGLHLLLLKTPAILCDMAAGILLYKTAKKKLPDTGTLLLSLMYLFNPAVFINSAMWGQVDSVFTLALLIMCLSLCEQKLLYAYVSFGIGVLLKPQMFIFAPVLLVGILRNVFLRDFSAKKLLHNLLQGALTLLGIVLVCAPFDISKVIAQYASTLASYPYATVNGYNFWGLLGLSWTSQDTPFLFLSCKTWGIIVILLIVLISFIIGVKSKEDNTCYFLIGAFIIVTMFVFSVRMHERYLYPALILLLFAYLHRPARQLYFCYGAFTVLHFYNTAHVMFFYDPSNYDRKAPAILLISAGMVLCACYFYYVLYRNPEASVTVHTAPYKSVKKAETCAPLASEGKLHLHKWDFAWILGITLLYSAIALYDLGDTTAPESSMTLKASDSITLDFGEDNTPASLSYYMGPSEKRQYTLETLNNESDTWDSLGDLTLSTVFTWKELSLSESSSKLRLTLKSPKAILFELVFKDASGNLLIPENASDYPALFDETHLFPERASFRNSMYFDEIYHARTAYEYLYGMYSYENTHPPLGKIFISIGVALFGMNPFGWRIIGTLFGILMVPITYVLGKRIFKETVGAVLTCILFTFDFMHFAQTRIATIDVYITFFVILMYYFMFRYATMSFYDTPLKKTFIPLGLCGLCMGLGFACKWTGAYAGAGLAVIFFATLLRRYKEYKFACTTPKKSTGDIAHAHIIKSFVPHTRKTILFCVGAFVLVPVLIYILSYIPFRDNRNTGLIARLLQNQATMFGYHSDLVAEHAFSSPFYKWPVMARPIWYYSGVISDTVREGISSFGNPLVWWVGIPAFLYVLYLAIRKKDRYAAFFTIGYLAQYLPWFFVSRLTFIYHYFPSVIFVVLMIVYSLLQLKKRLSGRCFLLITVLYTASVIVLFLLFYPVLSGQPVEAGFVDKWLRWFESWVLVAR